MAPRARTSVATNPFLAWTPLYTKTMEMMAASAFVIPHRVGRMMAAGHAPSAVDRREFQLMGAEKVEAAMLSSYAMAPGIFQWYLRFWSQAWQQMLALTMQWPKAMHSGFRYRPARVRRDLLGHLRLAQLATRTAYRGIVPLHAKATANAKRLSKFKH